MTENILGLMWIGAVVAWIAIVVYISVRVTMEMIL